MDFVSLLRCAHTFHIFHLPICLSLFQLIQPALDDDDDVALLKDVAVVKIEKTMVYGFIGCKWRWLLDNFETDKKEELKQIRQNKTKQYEEFLRWTLKVTKPQLYNVKQCLLSRSMAYYITYPIRNCSTKFNADISVWAVHALFIAYYGKTCGRVHIAAS